jgi:RNA polymerase sigma factor (sigma-70 family)
MPAHVDHGGAKTVPPVLNVPRALLATGFADPGRGRRTRLLHGWGVNRICRSARHQCDGRRRRLKWAAVRLGHAPGDRSATAPGVSAPTYVENRLVLYAALAKLPPRQRAVVVLRYLADHSVDETAEVLRMSPGTVKSHTFNGLAALRGLLAERHIDPNLGVPS